MKELNTQPPKPILETHYPIQQRGTKRWVAAQTKGPFKQKLMQNNSIESAYHRVIAIVKSALAGQSITYYDRDLKKDKSQGLYVMHSFITNSFYWRLECDLCCDYRIEYAFHNCPYEVDIRKLMRAYPLDRATRLKQFPTDLPTFYASVMRLQHKQFILTS